MSMTSTTGRRAGSTMASWGSATVPVLALVAVMWVIEAADAILPGSFDVWGIRPRSGEGLVGIVLAPNPARRVRAPDRQYRRVPRPSAAPSRSRPGGSGG